MVKGIPRPVSTRKNSCLQLKKCFKNGFQGYVAHAKDTTECKSPSIEDFLVLQEFADVFQEIPRLPLKRDVDFTTDLVPGATLVYKAQYIMATPELKELQMQLEELLKTGYIGPNVSPWGAPVLFVKKKDGTLRLCIDFR